jgi:hypothetical protein
LTIALNQRKMKKINLTLALLLLIMGLLYAQDPPDAIESDTFSASLDMFEIPLPMDITLTADLKAFQKNKNKDEYRDVHISYQFSDTTVIEHTLRMKPRGAFRKSECAYAPYWLNIRKADVVNEKLQEVKKIKMVSQCRGGKAYSDYVLKEYLAYKIYMLLSPVSFRVRLTRIKYVDTGRKNKVTESWGFLIEPEEMVAERNEAIVFKKDEISMRYMRTREMDVAAMFQYMIGNSDYSVAGRHNMKILGLPGFGSEGYTPVPYDFDYAGLVNAEYAIPGESLGISSVRERYYLGPCRENEEFQAAIDHIHSLREEILELVSDFPYLGDKHKKEMIAYLEDYFNSASGPNFISSKLKSTCR